VVLPDGCYFIAYGLLDGASPSHAGTLRVDSRSGRLAASADLYAIDSSAAHPENNPPPIGSMPPPGSGIPIFPISDDRLYLRMTKIEATETGFVLAFEIHRFIVPTFLTLDGSTSSQWASESAFTAQMAPAAAPPGYPKGELFFVGDVSRTPIADEPQPDPIGRLQIGWVSPSLRKAVVEIDRVPDAKVPQDNGAGVTWRSAFQSFGWEMKPIVSDDDVTKSSNTPWNAADVEAARQKFRDCADLDTEWRYYLLVASQIDTPGSRFGFMYHPQREALFITSQFVFPQTEAHWGALARPAVRRDGRVLPPRPARDRPRDGPRPQRERLSLHEPDGIDRAGREPGQAVPREHRLVLRSQ
jgi:hypothetical protein